jgi:methionyl-tRNA synthetase
LLYKNYKQSLYKDGEKTKNSKGKNKKKLQKTKEQREKEINEIKEKLEIHGLSNSFENIENLYEIFNKYIEDGFPHTGIIPLPGLKREIHYILSSKPHIVNSVNLVYNERV